MEKFKKKLVEMCKVNVKAAVVFIILALFFGFAGHWRQRRGCISSGGWYFCLCCNTDVWHSWNQEEAAQSPVEGNGGGGKPANPLQ